MEEILYIVLGAAWLIISFLGNKRRKQAQAQQTEEEEEYYPQEPYPNAPEAKPTSKQTEFEVLLDEFFGEPTKTQTPKSAEVVVEEMTIEPERRVFSEDYTFQGYETYESEVADFMPAASLEKYQGSSAVSEEYNFSHEGQSLESIDDLISSYSEQDRLADETSEQLPVAGLENEENVLAFQDFDAKRAIIYSEIINRKYA